MFAERDPGVARMDEPTPGSRSAIVTYQTLTTSLHLRLTASRRRLFCEPRCRLRLAVKRLIENDYDMLALSQSGAVQFKIRVINQHCKSPGAPRQPTRLAFRHDFLGLNGMQSAVLTGATRCRSQVHCETRAAR